jgi:hypothetical protein
VVALVVVALVLVGAASSYLGGRAYAGALESAVVGDLRGGQSALESGKTLLKQAANDRDAQKVAAAQGDFKRARQHFAAALSRAGGDTLLQGGSQVPVVSRYVEPRQRSVLAVAEMGLSLASAATSAADVELLLIDPSAESGQGGARLIGLLKAAEPKLAAARADLARAQSMARRIDPSVLPSDQRANLKHAMIAINDSIQSASELAQLIPVIFEVMGANGPRTYLIEQVNPAELRAGGGFIGTYSLVTADQGNLKVTHSGSVEEIDYPRPFAGEAGYVEPPPPIHRFVGDKSWVLGDSNFYPDFAANAQAAADFGPRELGLRPDGVIAFDPQLVAALLQVTGPITIASGGFNLESGSFVKFLFEYENVIGDRSRKALLGAIAPLLIDRISTLPSSSWTTLVNTLNTAADQRHLQLYFNNPEAESAIRKLGWGGQLNPASAPDFMYEMESNFGGTKANFFIDRSYDLTLSMQNGLLHHRLLVSLKNSTPDGYEGGRHYNCYVRLYYPQNGGDATLQNLVRDTARASVEKVPGLRLADGWFQININDLALGYATYQFIVEYDTPAVDMNQVHEIYWQKQPGTGPDRLTVNWILNGTRYSTSGDLAQDRVVKLTRSGVSIGPGVTSKVAMPGVGV